MWIYRSIARACKRKYLSYLSYTGTNALVYVCAVPCLDRIQTAERQLELTLSGRTTVTVSILLVGATAMFSAVSAMRNAENSNICLCCFEYLFAHNLFRINPSGSVAIKVQSDRYQQSRFR